MRLTIKTHFHEAVQLLLMHLNLVEGKAMRNIQEGLDIDYPNDSLSQEFVFWIALAQGCGLIDGYSLEKEQEP